MLSENSIRCLKRDFRRKAKPMCPTNFPVIMGYFANQEHIHSQVISCYRLPERNLLHMVNFSANKEPILLSSVIPKVRGASFWLHPGVQTKPNKASTQKQSLRFSYFCLHYKSRLWGRLNSASSPEVYGLSRMNGALQGTRLRNAPSSEELSIIALWNNRLEGWIRIFALAFIKSQRLSKTLLGEQLHLSFPLHHLSPVHLRIPILPWYLLEDTTRCWC